MLIRFRSWKLEGQVRTTGMKFIALLIFCICLAGRVFSSPDTDFEDDIPKKESQVVVLTSKTFEHLTQISTGSTTGDW